MQFEFQMSQLQDSPYKALTTAIFGGGAYEMAKKSTVFMLSINRRK